MAGTNKLQVYNEALEILGERSLASLTENRESRRILDNIWDNGFIDILLDEGNWEFATRSAKMIYDPSFTALFGYQYAWAMPSDCIRLGKVCSDEFITVPMTRYTIEAGQFFTDWEYTFISYVSNDPVTYGGNLGVWPQGFCRYAAAYLAGRAVKRITQSEAEYLRLMGNDGKKGLVHTLLVQARSKDAVDLPTKFLPQGAWTTARGGYGTSRRDGGSRANLVG